MARVRNKLSARGAAALQAPGRHSDGGGLYLSISADGRRRWVFLFTYGGKQREMGLGSARDVSLSRARELAEAARTEVAAGRDPLTPKLEEVSVPTFGKFADDLADTLAAGFRNAKHAAQWKTTLGDAYCAKLRKKLVSDVTTDDVKAVLDPIWSTKQETASRIRGRIERVLDAAKARGLRSGENPARWRGHLDALLPKRQKLARGHHAAMPYKYVPAFMGRLKGLASSSTRALSFAILSAARSGEVMGARWREFDLDGAVWTVPGARMKAGREHRVPLTTEMTGILEEMALLRSADDVDGKSYVFPGAKKDSALSAMALTMTMRRLKQGDFTPHGFRSAFRDWVSEETDFPREIAEAALAHVVGDQTERAYRRGDALAKRAELMKAWSEFCHGVRDAPQGAEPALDIFS